MPQKWGPLQRRHETDEIRSESRASAPLTPRRGPGTIFWLPKNGLGATVVTRKAVKGCSSEQSSGWRLSGTVGLAPDDPAALAKPKSYPLVNHRTLAGRWWTSFVLNRGGAPPAPHACSAFSMMLQCALMWVSRETLGRFRRFRAVPGTTDRAQWPSISSPANTGTRSYQSGRMCEAGAKYAPTWIASVPAAAFAVALQDTLIC